MRAGYRASMTDNGWQQSASAWIAAQGEHGDWSRTHVLDAPMLARVAASGARNAIDIGCGEGRFCRMLRARGVDCTGIEPTPALLAAARARDPGGTYLEAMAESLPLGDAAIDLAVFYLTLIDIDDQRAAIGEAHRVLRPGGRLLIANLQAFATAGHWTDEPRETRRFILDGYMDARAVWSEWSGIRIRNWHRPLGDSMMALLDTGFELTHFAEPEPVGASPVDAARYRRAPWLMLMEWRKAV